MSNKEYHQLSNKFVEQKPALSPTIQVNIKLDIKAYKTHSLPLEIMMTREIVKKLTTTTTINPYLSAPTADTGAQVIILGHNHLSKIGLHIACLHRTAAVLDCANASATGALGVKSVLTGNTLVHRGIVYVT